MNEATKDVFFHYLLYALYIIMAMAIIAGSVNACKDDPVDPLLGFWREIKGERSVGYAFFSDGQIMTYTDLCQPVDSTHDISVYQRTDRGVLIQGEDRLIYWDLEFVTSDFIKASQDGDVFTLEREIWGK